MKSAPRTSIRSKLTWSHISVVVISLFIYATGGFVVLLLGLWYQGVRLPDIVRNIDQFIGLTVFVIFNIGLVAVCSVLVSGLASWRIAKSLTRQVDELAAAAADYGEGRFDRRAAVLSDDELGHLARGFNDLASRLQSVEVRRREFVANISHDLRTPVAIIRGHLEAQTSPESERPPAGAAFRVIDRETQTLSKLIDDLFTLSRLEEAALPIATLPVNLAALIEDSVGSIRPYALQQSRVSVNAQVATDLPRVVGDETRIRQIISNLVHNAVRHTPAGGLVVVTAEPRDARVVVTVRDTGVGIPADKVPFIFDRFWSGESQREGTGLGLSIVKQLVEAQGGTVSVSSVVGEGTAISFDLPAAS